mmetsp:Transcript_36810/g.117157  ORF Transcript_36810/g.117157 Transcript_36810/m.117157 type:complete len:211 (-) Transcript_36810:77-709(-)
MRGKNRHCARAHAAVQVRPLRELPEAHQRPPGRDGQPVPRREVQRDARGRADVPPREAVRELQPRRHPDHEGHPVRAAEHLQADGHHAHRRLQPHGHGRGSGAGKERRRGLRRGPRRSAGGERRRRLRRRHPRGRREAHPRRHLGARDEDREALLLQRRLEAGLNFRGRHSERAGSVASAGGATEIGSPDRGARAACSVVFPSSTALEVF